MAKQTREEIAAALTGHKAEKVIFSGRGARIVMVTEIKRTTGMYGMFTDTSFRVEFLKEKREPDHTTSLDIALDVAMDYE
jgi:hypothetical protein